MLRPPGRSGGRAGVTGAAAVPWRTEHRRRPSGALPAVVRSRPQAVPAGRRADPGGPGRAGAAQRPRRQRPGARRRPRAPAGHARPAGQGPPPGPGGPRGPHRGRPLAPGGGWLRPARPTTCRRRSPASSGASARCGRCATSCGGTAPAWSRSPAPGGPGRPAWRCAWRPTCSPRSRTGPASWRWRRWRTRTVLLPAVAQALGVPRGARTPAARARARGAGRPGDPAPPGQRASTSWRGRPWWPSCWPPAPASRSWPPAGRRCASPGSASSPSPRWRSPTPAGPLAARGPGALRGHPAVRRAGAGRPAGVPAHRRRRRGGGGDLRPPGRAPAGARARRRAGQAAAAAGAAGAPGGRARRGRPAPAHRGRAGRPGPPADAARHHRLEPRPPRRRPSGPSSGAWRSSPGAAPWRPPRPSAPAPAGPGRAATSWRGSLRWRRRAC